MGDLVLVSIPGWAGHRAHPDAAQWWTTYVALGVAQGLRKPTLVQAYGDSKLSGGTHLDGTAFDLATIAADLPRWARLARANGAAAWPRGRLWGQKTMSDHVHLILDHPATVEGRWQITEARRGGDGLTGTRPDYLAPTMGPMTAIQGLAAMARIIGDPFPDYTIPPQEDDMTPDQATQLAEVHAWLQELREQRTPPRQLTIVDDQTHEPLGIALVHSGQVMHPSSPGVVDAYGWAVTAPAGGQIGTGQLDAILGMQGAAQPDQGGAA